MARVMVKGRNHVFFDISNQNFDIISTVPTYALMASPASQTACPPGMVTYTINVESINGYLSPVTLSVSGQPAGSSVSFSVNPVIPGNTSQLGITIPAGAIPGNYLLTINGISAAGPKSTTATLVILESLTVPALVSPENEEIGVPVNAILDWAASTGASYYEIELATNAAFNSIVFGDTTIATMISPGTLNEETTYYWRVRAVNACAMSAWSPTREFETAHCDLSYSTDVPVPIPNGGTPTITSDLVWTISAEIADVNVIDLTGTHTWLGELRFILTSPSGTNVVLIDQWCTSQNNFNINLDDEAAPGLPPCPYNNGNTYQSEEPLAAFIGEEAQGTWVLTIQDLSNGNGGSLNSWALEICAEGGCTLLVTSYANAGEGSLRDALDCASSGDTITFAPIMIGGTIKLLTPLVISDDVHILATSIQNITLNASLTTAAILTTTLTEVSLAELTIIGGSALTGCGIQNGGDLLLKNVTINPGLQPAQPLIANLGALTLEGNCQISQ
jgi:subtilisin-like proprotein convertase family protein